MLPIVKGLLAGERRALARAISIVDNDEPESREIIRQIFSKIGGARTVGFTGPGGAGKSSLVGRLIPECQALGYRVAVLAVDPTSPLTGGAILGDRVRMQGNLDDEKVFMRSMASRGAVGGVSKSLRNAIRILDAAGYNLVLVESVGAGQLEIEISKVVDITAVLFTPHTGDNVQAVKAGLTEIGDMYIINKSDLEGAGALYNTIVDLIGDTDRKPVVLKASAKTGKGVRELAKSIDKLLKEKSINYKERERRMLENELRDMVLNTVEKKASQMLAGSKKYSEFVDKLTRKEIDPYAAAEELAAGLFR
ncbi:ABC transporter, ATP-binding protein [Candidatus Nitrososphaera gargensis Ga9.2]|uniref:ABC transporter, ATP-binding protein n=1 Tax=Nitrososphaera gargensis (strain Ga9.2) TaxID=1237085 RepID=K0INI3_NITGG|nr:methylmalonyl Co-A mutase-associated GTPase MeaB [Candidatus Nitrososphaera gargensis]AFU59424.1 ABC transporter, ATP-binding protein [Candidatus Nitrososphaera gargensis Ga9.2]